MPQAESYEDDEGAYADIGPAPQQDADFFKFRVESLDVVEELQHQLRGEVFNQTTQKYEKKFDRWLNEKGINKITHIIYALGMNKNTILGCLDKEQILFKCNKLKRYMAKLIMIKHREYSIDRSMWDLLLTTVVNTVHSGLSRSELGRESTQLSTAHQRHDLFSHNETPKASMIEQFLGRKKQRY